MSTAYTGSFQELLNPQLREVIYNKFAEQPTVYDRIYRIQDSDGAYEDDIRMGGLQNLATKGEGTPISYDAPVQGTRQRTQNITYARGFRVSKEMYDDDRYDVMNRMAEDLGRSARHHMETLGAAVLNDAFSGSTYTDPEGDALCASHTLLKSGGTDANLLSPGVSLSNTGIQSAYTIFETLLDESGRYVSNVPSQLLIHPQERFQAKVLLNSSDNPETANRSISPLSGENLTVIRWPHLSDLDAWFMLAAPDERDCLVWQDRESLTYDSSVDGQTKDMLNDVMYRAAVKIIDWRGIVGSAP